MHIYIVSYRTSNLLLSKLGFVVDTEAAYGCL